MRIAIDRLLSDGLGLELPRDDGEADRLQLERGVGVRGVFVSTPETIALEGVAADELDAARVGWHLGASSRLVSAPLVLGGLEIDLRIARGAILHGRERVAGHVAAREVAARAVGLDIGGTHLAAAVLEAASASYRTGQGGASEVRLDRLALQALAVALSGGPIEIESIEGRGGAVRFGGGVVEVALATLELRGARAKLGELEIAFGAATASDVRLSRTAKGWVFACGSLSLREAQLRRRTLRVAIDRAELAAGLRYDHGNITVGAAVIDEIEIDAPLEAEAPPESGNVARRSTPLDLRVLDALSGRVNVDVNVDVKLPVIQRRVATHKLRVPITDGTIDFHELERDLSFLEDAVLDFKVKGDRLVFQKDIPLIPFDEETIVYWPLDDDEIALANRNHVRLRRLADVKLPEQKKKAGAKEDSSVELVQLDLDPIDCVLRIDGPAEIVHGGAVVRLGAEGKPGLAELRVTGAVRHRPGKPPQPGELRVEARELCLGLTGLAAGAQTIGAEVIEVGAIAGGQISFEGVRPIAVRARVRGIGTRNVRVAYRATST